MATSSEIKAALDAVAKDIAAKRARLKAVVSEAADISAALASLPTVYQGVIATINAFPANTTDTFEALQKAELAKLSAEFTAMKGKVDQIAAVDFNV